MKRWYGLNDLEGLTTRPVVAIGVYDGFTVVTESSFEKLLRMRHRQVSNPVVLTFDPESGGSARAWSGAHQAVGVGPATGIDREPGVDAALVMTFDEELSKQTPADFVHGVLGDAPNASQVVVGRTSASVIVPPAMCPICGSLARPRSEGRPGAVAGSGTHRAGQSPVEFNGDTRPGSGRRRGGGLPWTRATAPRRGGRRAR